VNGHVNLCAATSDETCRYCEKDASGYFLTEPSANCSSETKYMLKKGAADFNCGRSGIAKCLDAGTAKAKCDIENGEWEKIGDEDFICEQRLYEKAAFQTQPGDQ
jgi:hypothetical protein